jgi:flagellar motility protein MotE (MotC chaperone)
MVKLLRSKAALAAIAALVYVASMTLFIRPKHLARPAAPAASAASPAASGAGPSWDFYNADLDLLIAELKSEREALAQREQQLNDLAKRLQSERVELNAVTQHVHQLQLEFDKNVVRVREEEMANLKKLAKLYAAMTPEGAYAVFAEMQDEQLLKILIFMKEQETAPVLEVMAKSSQAEARRAARLTDRLRLTSAKPVPTTPKPSTP